MRFKGTLTQRGQRCLGRGFLPTFQRFSKTVVMILGPEEVHLVSHGGLAGESDGPAVCVVRLGSPLVFEKGPICESKHGMNLIAFEFDLKLFERVLHGASSNEAEGLEMKLSMRRVPNADNQARPFLSFQMGGSISITSELPISKPFPSSEVDQLIHLIRSDQACPFYVDLMPVAMNLNSSLQKLKKLSPISLVSLIRTGDAHFQAFRMQSGCTVGVEYKGLEVIPENQRVAEDPDMAEQRQPTSRLSTARTKGLSARLAVSTKQLAKVVSVCQYTKPAKLLCGTDSRFLHFLYVYLDSSGSSITDKESMSIKLPYVSAG
ncbi:DNA damage checkpoint protein HUS1 [Chloropicon primus]|uniref:DNA damage checkpoint protein HUS1 n=1 Tax=Chloropicon primus TaxID=1764295 RepID=A0A5B8MQV3_9CHLO|nr:DNA damage checkpoint protein HUS1 [Chloropicon primus]UPR02312.1 DNA damage checkpoint protein HUS1 [Chloropicon primus]|mmetsp:Transcript_4058/g.11788  ORF Transcript_4058/g.11788 Transcript_4058/m.11788 type:complete len:320 (+) Transcript_4058:362-1321(+)|eukprot:QDZ23098.1 DNA damage checkpoint protein HUS1 [Chloropicon primus]